MFLFSQVVRLLGYHGNLLRADQEKGPELKRTRSCFKKKTPKTPKAAEKKLTIPDRSLALKMTCPSAVIMTLAMERHSNELSGCLRSVSGVQPKRLDRGHNGPGRHSEGH